MNATRAFNVMTLTTILLLAGCLGADDSSAAADDHTHDADPNAAPAIFLQDSSDLMWDPVCEISELENATCTLMAYHAVVDPDGDLMTFGWDSDLDGAIDIQLTEQSGFTNVTFLQSHINIVELTDDDGDIAGEAVGVSVAFIATDSNGASSAEILTILEFNDDDEVFDEDDTGGSLDSYTFSDADATGTMDDGGSNALVEITMTQGTDLNWAMLKVTIKVDSGTPTACGDADSDAACTWTPFEGEGNDQAWEASEGITISEGSGDLCDGSNGGCEIEVTLPKMGTGQDADKVLGTVNAYASSA